MTETEMFDALDELDRRKEQMQEAIKLCPSWCIGDHIQALEEGCDVESAAVHISGDMGHFLPDLRNPLADRLDRPGGAGWRVELVAGEARGPSGMPLIHMEVDEPRDEKGDRVIVNVFLSSGEARMLAAQLISLADRDDIGRWA